ncbi:MAG: hypothetical protein PHE29_07165 [Tissierellia bacterium]|nr:hypothetical protein [Tissierellia bacterium]MDD4781224.1 hypothetical protein [Tissierellia bacterium]
MKKILVFVIILLILLSSSILAEPGDSKDPIVLLSYLEDRLANFANTYKLDSIKSIQTKINDLEGKLSSGSEITSKSSEFDIVQINDGQKIIAESGTEIILRSGEAFVIGSELGGISDVTEGVDIPADKKIKSNHFLLVPRSDGRGVYTNNSALFMVRGAYEVIE